jgi:ubiquinone/menaquinone biosynthesis C-methylase UbiE
VAPETDEERRQRERQRLLFDEIADRYDETRRGYPGEIIGTVVRTAGLSPGASVLEIGCGTGQLTRQLAGRGFRLRAIDIGPTMVNAAQRNVIDPDVSFELTSFEDFAASDRSFDLIVSATAFHWVDPEVAWSKVARLLRPHSWLALLTTGEHYDDPFGVRLRDLWMKRSSNGGGNTVRTKPTWAETIAQSDLFAHVVEASHSYRLRLPAQVVLGVECTRATFLSYSESDRAAFVAETPGDPRRCARGQRHARDLPGHGAGPRTLRRWFESRRPRGESFQAMRPSGRSEQATRAHLQPVCAAVRRSPKCCVTECAAI